MDGIQIKNKLQKEVKNGDLKLEDINDRLDYYLENIRDILKEEKIENEKLKRKLSYDQKNKINKICGGFTLSDDFIQIIENEGLVPGGSFGYDLKRRIEDNVKKNNTSTDEIPDVIISVIVDKQNNLSDKEKEKIEKERVKRQKKQEKEQKELLKRKEKAENKREKIRKGVNCKVPKNVHGQKGHSGLTKGVATLGFGLIGWVATSGSKSELQKMLIPATIKVVPKGVIIEAQNEEPIRLPFDKIVKAVAGYNLSIQIVDGRKVLVENCSDYNEVSFLINESACGIDEEGWE